MKCCLCKKSLNKQEYAVLMPSNTAVHPCNGNICNHTVCFVCLSDVLVEQKATAEQMQCPKCSIPIASHVKKIPNKADKEVHYKNFDPDFDPVRHWYNSMNTQEREGMTMVYFAHWEEKELFSATSFIRADGQFADEESQENVIEWSGLIGRALYGNGRGVSHCSEKEYDRNDGGAQDFCEHIAANKNPGFRFMLHFGHHHIENGVHYQTEIAQCYVAHCMMMQLRMNRIHPPFPCHSELQWYLAKVLLAGRVPNFAIETLSTFGLSLSPDLARQFGKAIGLNLELDPVEQLIEAMMQTKKSDDDDEDEENDDGGGGDGEEEEEGDY